MDELVPLVTSLSRKEVLHGEPEHFLHQARLNRKYGTGFRELPCVSRSESGHVNYVLVHHCDFILVIFPGSRTCEDWTSGTGNLVIKRVSEMGGKVHQGFWKQVNSYWGIVARQLGQGSDVPVVLAGHSRGGACAVISALRVEHELGIHRIGAVITLGEPGCINYDIASRINTTWGGQYARIVSSTDPVPLAPSKPWYHRAGVMWFYDKDGTRWIDPTRDVMEEVIRRDNPFMQAHRDVPMCVLALMKQAWECKKGHDLAHYHILVN